MKKRINIPQHLLFGFILWICMLLSSAATINNTIQHIVQPGETLHDIAEMYRLSPEQIIQKNNLDATSPLLSGQQLELLMPDTLKNTDNHNNKAQEPQPKTSTLSNKKNQTQLKGLPYAYFANGEAVEEALKSFASNYGIPIIINDQVDSIVNGKIGPFPPIEFLDTIARLNNLIWYFDGDTLYIYNSNQIIKTIVNLEYLSINNLKNSLIEMGIWDSRYGWKERPKDGLIYLSGPPRYVELVIETATLLDSKSGERKKSQLDFKVFPLKYARAEDYLISYRNQQVKIPGVATILKQIVLQSDGRSIVMLESPTQSQSLNPVTPITGKQPPKLAEQNVQTQSTQPNQKQIASENVVINADKRSNSIIIYDLASKMPMYENLIKTLDKPLSQVEINVSIIDVDTTSIDEIGVNWKLDSKGGKSFLNFDPSDKLLQKSSSTILNSTAGRLMSQVKLLATQNKAKILSRPSILTLNNTEAVLDNNQTFYVKVQGGDSNSNTAQLYPITSGSVLKVTPRIITEEKTKNIHLDVNIQDGNSESTSNLGSDVTLPIVKNTTISTQAMVSENQSLLIGGYFYEKKSTKVEKIPLLGDIPIVGQLFRQNSDHYTKNVRLFLITPKIVNSI